MECDRAVSLGYSQLGDECLALLREHALRLMEMAARLAGS
jgi:hypothetical protein